MIDIDLTRTQALLKGAAQDPEATGRAYHAEKHGWVATTNLLAGPLVIITALLVPTFGWVFGTNWVPGFAGFFAQLIVTMMMGVAGLGLSATVFGFLAGRFGAKHDFDQAFAAVSLAAVPAFAGQILGTLPWIGWVFAWLLGIYSVVLLYRNLPLFLGVPANKRITHFVIGFIPLFLFFLLICQAWPR